MKKLTLDPCDLKVESFGEARGAVQGHALTDALLGGSISDGDTRCYEYGCTETRMCNPAYARAAR